MSIKEVKSLTELGKFVRDYRSDIPHGECDNRIADAFFAEEANENDAEIKKDYASKAKRLLGRMSKKAKALSGQARKEAWARFWDLQGFYKHHGVLQDTPQPTDEKRARWLKLGLHVKKSLKIARRHAHYLLSQGLVPEGYGGHGYVNDDPRCIIAKCPDSGMFGVFTKQGPINPDTIIEEITLADNAAHVEITPSPYRHGDKIMKHFNCLVCLDHWIAASYVELPVRAYTAWGAEASLMEICPEIKVLHVTEKGTDWENDDFPVDDTVIEVGGEDEHYANSVADLTSTWATAEQQHDQIMEQLDNAISEQLAAERGEEL